MIGEVTDTFQLLFTHFIECALPTASKENNSSLILQDTSPKQTQRESP